jgi:hypothetical protein
MFRLPVSGSMATHPVQPRNGGTPACKVFQMFKAVMVVLALQRISQAAKYSLTASIR